MSDVEALCRLWCAPKDPDEIIEHAWWWSDHHKRRRERRMGPRWHKFVGEARKYIVAHDYLQGERRC